MLWDGLGGLTQLAPAPGVCHANVATHCEVFPYLYNNSLLPTALDEKATAANLYAQLNSTVVSAILPHVPDPATAAVLRGSLEAGVLVSRAVLLGWTIMAEGYSGDRSGVYNRTAIAAAIHEYDATWVSYRQLPSRYPGLGIMSDAHWSHASTGVPGMGASVDRYRHLDT